MKKQVRRGKKRSLLSICMLALSLWACSPSGVLGQKHKAVGQTWKLAALFASSIYLRILSWGWHHTQVDHISSWNSKTDASGVVVSVISSHQQMMVRSIMSQKSDFHQKRPIKSEFQVGKSEKLQRLWNSELNMAANIINTGWKHVFSAI